jgi:hypothetical protein
VVLNRLHFWRMEGLCYSEDIQMMVFESTMENYRLLECKESSKVADSRDVELIFLTDGELIDEIGNSIKIYFTSENYDIIHLGNVSYYKVSKYENLTKGD